MIASLGIPEILVSDNASTFTSEEFKQFYAEEWCGTCEDCTLSSNGACWESSPNIQEGDEVGTRGFTCDKVVGISVQVSHNPS